MISVFDDTTVLHDIDFIGVPDGGKPVRDHERGTALHQAGKRVLYEPLALGVKRGGSLVEDQDGRILEHGAGDGDALPLAARELCAPISDVGVIALRQGTDEPVGIRHAGSRLNGFPADPFLTEGDVAVNRVVEQECLLGHDAHQ